MGHCRDAYAQSETLSVVLIICSAMTTLVMTFGSISGQYRLMMAEMFKGSNHVLIFDERTSF